MAIQPKEKFRPYFRRTMRGYSPEQVDAYVKSLTENYAALYREKTELEKRLAESEARFTDIDDEIAEIKEMRIDAQRAANAIVKEAYQSADSVLATVRKTCDASLTVFRNKVAEYQKLITSLKREVKSFRNELFEKYRLHIELIDHLAPADSPDEIEFTADRYAEKIVTTLKREITAEYGLTIDDVQSPYMKEEKSAPAQSGTIPDGDGLTRVGKVPHAGITSVGKQMTRLIDEYRDNALAEVPDGVQLELDIDAGTVKVGDNT